MHLVTELSVVATCRRALTRSPRAHTHTQATAPRLLEVLGAEMPAELAALRAVFLSFAAFGAASKQPVTEIDGVRSNEERSSLMQSVGPKGCLWRETQGCQWFESQGIYCSSPRGPLLTTPRRPASASCARSLDWWGGAGGCPRQTPTSRLPAARSVLPARSPMSRCAGGGRMQGAAHRHAGNTNQIDCRAISCCHLPTPAAVPGRH